MKSNIATAVSNGVTITTSMACCFAYLYHTVWRRLDARPLIASTLIITSTILMFGVQLAYPEIIQALRLDVAALRAGEVWRLVTPLFIQPYGIFQFLFNMLFLSVFLPMGERLYGPRIWLLYFASGVVGQLVNCAWRPGGGGSSTAIFGGMGSILVYVLIRGKIAPRQYPVFATLGICGAVVMCFNQDGHGPGFLTGAALGALICRVSPPKLSDNPLRVSANT